MTENRRKLEQAGKSDDSVPPDREDILHMSLGFRPGDPFESMVKFKMAQYADNLKWLEANRPTGKPIRGALFARCEELTKEYLRVATNSGSTDALNQLQKLDWAMHAILYWIKAGHGQPLSGRQIENYALFMDLFGVPIPRPRESLALPPVSYRVESKCRIALFKRTSRKH